MLAVAQDFLRRQGLTGALLVVIAGMLWFDRVDRREAGAENRAVDREHALFVRDAAAQVQQFGIVLQAHVSETEEADAETLRVLRALCYNAAAGRPDAQARCEGRR